MPVQLPPKKDVALALLQQSTVFIHLDPRVDDVVVPAWFKMQPQLVLQVGLNMPVPIPDLHLDDDCVSCTLSFNRSPFYCRIPWSAVFALIGEDRRGMVWPNDVPSEVAVQVQAQARAQRERAEQRSHLRVVPGETGPAGDEPAAAGAAGGSAEAGKKAVVKRKPAKQKAVAKQRPAPKKAVAKQRPAPKKAVAKQRPAPKKQKAAARNKPAPATKPAAAKKRQPARSAKPRATRAVDSAPRPEGGTVTRLVQPSKAGASTSQPGAGKGKRAKRKLPPYLRVVK
jgi:stringent starvation protein B